MGETRVDLLHLLEDLRDAYPGSLEETILTEIVANALDSGARSLILATDPAAATLTVTDDGRGMTRRELSRYHDVAATTKQRGRGIGFAGVGIKLGLLACHEVITETRQRDKSFATAWHLKSRHRAPWRWREPLGLVGERGTAVRLVLTDPLSPLLDSGFLESNLRRHFAPLIDPDFAEILERAYPHGVRFVIDGRPVATEPNPVERAPIAVRLPRRRKLSAYGYLSREVAPEPGVAISTLGKVIKRGWDWLGVTPTHPDRVSGLVEVPDLAECLTLNKADFIRAGQRGAVFLAFRKAIQEVVAAQLAAWGDAPESEPRRRSARPVERDLEAVLADLAREFPLLATLVDRRPGGQRRLPFEGKAGEEAGAGALPLIPVGTSGSEPEPQPGPVATGLPQPEPPPTESESPVGHAPLAVAEARLGGAARKRPAHYGLRLEFESRPDDPALGRLVESTVLINDAHPAYRRAVASRSEGYHLALAVAMSLAALAVEPDGVHGFVESFMARWGESGSGRRRG
ncbi:MAG: ATP-binding protein [Gemmatimonadetes bacterium]|nr:ATP-binding protein [Gemmatimonadota bacterium]